MSPNERRTILPAVPRSPIRVGVVGAGTIVENNHLPLLCGRPDVAVAWVTDADPIRAARLAGMYRLRAVPAGEVDAALADADVCLIAIPLGARGPYLDACRRRGVGVYVEKPFARTLAEHDALLAGLPPHTVAVGLQRRFYRAVQTVRAVAAGGLFGPPRAVRADLGSYAVKSGGGRYIIDPKLSGGGVLIELGVHVLDQVVFALGGDDTHVEAATGLTEGGLDFHVEFASTLRVGADRVPVAGRFSRLVNLPSGVTVSFDRAEVRFGIGPADPVLVCRPDAPGQVFRLAPERGTDGANTVDGAMAAAWTAFLTGWRTGTVTPAAAVTSRVTTRWIELVYQKVFHG